MKKQLPNAVLHFATKKSFEAIVSQNPYLDKIHLLDKEFGPFIKELKSEKFDLIIDLHKNLRSLRVKASLFPVPSKAFNKANVAKWLLVRKWRKDPIEHVVSRYMKTVESLGVKYDGLGLDFFGNESPDVQLPDRYIAYAIGGSWGTKKMPVAQISALLEKTEEKCWVLVGGKEDSEAGQALVNKHGSRVLNLCGRLSIHQSAEVLKRAELIVSHDTGMMHIAAAMGKKVISIWGNTVPEFGFAPWYAENTVSDLDVRFEVAALKCRPCSKIGFAQCPQSHFDCMQKQDINAIAAVIKS